MNWETELPDAEIVYGRQQPVYDRCRGRRVLHLGCVDAGLLEERFEAGLLMHQKLAAVTADLWGVDIDEEGIRFLAERGFTQLVAADVSAGVPELDGRTFDIIVASEVVEHLDNPGAFLRSVHGWMTPGETELIITVPNAFRVDTLLGLFRGVETVHPDHNYWFSYRTATNVLIKAGFEVLDVTVYSLQPRGLLPDLLRRTPAPAHPGEGASGPRPSLAWRGLDYLRSLPRRLLVTFLYSRTVFWGDGLILTARVPA